MKTIIVLALLAGVAWCQVPVISDHGLNFPLEEDTSGETDPANVRIPTTNWDPVNNVSVFSRSDEPSFGPFIIDGQPSVYGDHPYTCSLHFRFEGFWYFVCGATIYNERTVMTSVFCVQNRPASDLRVTCGDYNVFEFDEFEVTERITDVTTHRRFRLDPARGFPANIAVLRVERPLVFNAFVNTLPIPKTTQELTQCQIVGWGLTEPQGETQDILQEADSTFLPNRVCADLWSRRQISNGHACFIDQVACRGDAGSPAVCSDPSGDRKFLVGLASWGNASCPTNMPAVYVRLSFYSRWLRENEFSDYVH